MNKYLLSQKLYEYILRILKTLYLKYQDLALQY